MANYNFEKDTKDFGETIRIGEINKEVKKQEMTNIEEEPSSEYIPRRRTVSDASPKRFNNLLKIAVVFGVIIFVCVFVIAFISSSGGKVKAPAQDSSISQNGAASNPSGDVDQALIDENGQYGIIEDLDDNGRTRLYDIREKGSFYVELSRNISIKDGNGKTIDYSGLRVGDIVIVSFDESSKEAESIVIPESVWIKENITGAAVDKQNSSVSYGSGGYLYGKETRVFWKDKALAVTDISEADIVTLRGINNMLFSAVIEEYHGNIRITGLEEAKNAEISVDGEEYIKIEDNKSIPVSKGVHRILIKADGISDYEEEIFIIEGEDYEIDLKTASEKMSSIILTANVSGYAVIIDGSTVSSEDGIFPVKQGEHLLQIVMGGYNTWESKVTVEQMPLEIYAKLEKNVEQSKGDITIYSEPGWAEITVDGEYLGVAPVLTGLPYGEHYITAELEGYEKTLLTVNINSPDRSVTISMKKIN